MHFGLSPLQSGGDFDATIAECERAEAAGFDSVWLGEHHNSTLLYPAPLVGLAAIAGRTRRVRLGTGVLLLPLYHPLAVAEEAAMVDVISRGRLILGVGAGYAPEEFAAFGVSLKERGSRLDEAVPLIHRLWTEDAVSHEGRHYRIGSATLRPRPVQRPRPPIWFAGWVEAALRRAGRLGDAWLGGPSAKLDELAGCVRMYREAMRTAGRDAGGGEVALMRYVFVAESLERARAVAGAAFIRSFEETYFRWPHPVVKRPAGEMTIARLSEDRIILGDPAKLPSTDRALPDRARAHTPHLPHVRGRHPGRRGDGIDGPLHTRGHAGPQARSMMTGDPPRGPRLVLVVGGARSAPRGRPEPFGRRRG